MAKEPAIDTPYILEIDIRTRTISDNEGIYVVRPGAGFSLYRSFDTESRVFLDFPGLDLDFGKKPDGYRDITTLREKLIRSVAVREWHQSGQQKAAPDRSLEGYRSKAKSHKRVGRWVGDVGRLYYEFKPGTIIVVPGPGYISDVLIGVIVGEPEEASDLQLYPGETIPVRKVQWLGRKLKATFTPDLRGYLARPDPVMRLDASFRDEILRAAFDQYIFDGTIATRLETTRPDFSTLDDYNLQTFIAFIAGTILAADEEDDALDEVDFGTATSIFSDHPEEAPELTANINSPGYLRLSSGDYSRLRLAPVTIGVLLTALAAIPAGAQLPPIKVVNSAAVKGDTCAVEVMEQVSLVMQVSGTTDMLKACNHGTKVISSVGLKTAMTVKRRLNTDAPPKQK